MWKFCQIKGQRSKKMALTRNTNRSNTRKTYINLPLPFSLKKIRPKYSIFSNRRKSLQQTHIIVCIRYCFVFAQAAKKSQTIAVLSPKQNVGFSPSPLSKLVESGGRVKKKQIGASQFFFSIHMTFISNCRKDPMRA